MAIHKDFPTSPFETLTQYNKSINVIRVGEMPERWTGDYVFENEWQSFRTKKDRSLEMRSIEFEYEKGKRYKIAVKVVDIFGNDTMKIIEVGV